MLKKIFLVAVGLWIIISALRLLINVSQIGTEEISTFSKNDNEKREIHYGDIYNLIQEIEKGTSQDKKIGVISYEGKNFYLARYYLYPRKVFWIKNIDTLQEKKPDALLFYQFDNSFSDLIIKTRAKKINSGFIVL